MLRPLHLLCTVHGPRLFSHQFPYFFMTAGNHGVLSDNKSTTKSLTSSLQTGRPVEMRSLQELRSELRYKVALASSLFVCHVGAGWSSVRYFIFPYGQMTVTADICMLAAQYHHASGRNCTRLSRS